MLLRLQTARRFDSPNLHRGSVPTKAARRPTRYLVLLPALRFLRRIKYSTNTKPAAIQSAASINS
jgi:hypothetical protein